MPITASHFTKWLADPSKRAWIYDVALALGPVAVMYGLLTEQEVAVWLGVVNTLTSGLARANVSK